MADAASRLTTLAEELLGGPLPVRLRAWDGSEAGPAGGPVLIVRDRRALRRMIWKPGELGLARAWVAGEIDVEGDLYELLDRLSGLLWERGGESRGLLESVRDPRLRAAARALLRLAGPLPPPQPPAEEMRGRSGSRHSRRRDKQAISHHYDVGNDFYALVLGPSMVYSCAYWTEDGTLEEAQHDKLDLIARKLNLKEGDRLLDVGCGWGSMAIHAAREYGARVVGVTLSREQAAFARKRIAEEGLTDLIEIRVQDYRDVTDGPYDAISSIGMAEHVGAVKYREYADTLYALLKPGGAGYLNRTDGVPHDERLGGSRWRGRCSWRRPAGSSRRGGRAARRRHRDQDADGEGADGRGGGEDQTAAGDLHARRRSWPSGARRPGRCRRT
ncbi:Ubiquinone biosynthesis O-methyltransferase, mitochondrial [Streptomyces tanashiensis]